MKIIKLFVLILVMISNTLLLCGCWNYHDIDKNSIVAGFAIDKSPHDHKYLITVEIVDFEMSGRDAKVTPIFIKSEGDTIIEAIRRIIRTNGKRLYWAHAELVIIDKAIAEESIIPVIDLLSRDAEIREQIHIAVSEERTASEVLMESTVSQEIHAYDMYNILKNQKSTSESQMIMVFELINVLEEEGISATLPAFGTASTGEKKTSVLSGTAVFNSNKLIGFLDIDESKYFNFAIDKINKGIFVVQEKSGTNPSRIALEIFKSKTKVKPKYENNELSMDIYINTEVAIAEEETSLDYMDDATLKQIQATAEKELKSCVEKVIAKVKDDYKTDIFGFGRIVKANLPHLWKEIGSDWNEIFCDLNVNVTVKISIKNSALSSKPIIKGD